MEAPIKVLTVNGGRTMRAPSIRALLARCYADPKFEVDSEALCDWLEVELDNPNGWIKLFVAHSEEYGLCGMSIVTVSIDPLNPYPWCPHLVAERPGAFHPIVEASLGYARSLGFKKMAIYNCSEASDAGHIRMNRRHAKGTVRGSMILYEIEG